MDKLFGLYKGIVVENSGYQRDGTFIPGTVLVKIDGITPRRFVERYKGIPSKNVGGTLDKDTAIGYEIPAYIMTPIMGESSMGKYNASSNKSSISDVTTDAAGFGSSKIPLKPPSAQFSIMSQRDKFSDGPEKNGTTINNSDGNSFFPDHRYKAGKGVFAVPEVSARVLIQFCNGSRSFPIIIGKLNTSDEIEGYYTAGDTETKPTYPFFFQNNSNPRSRSLSSSTAANEGDGLSLVDEFQALSNEQLDITKNIVGGNLTESQKSKLIARGEVIRNQSNNLVDRANDSQINQLAGISVNTQQQIADIYTTN
jgi:hypothetical protein